MSTLYWLFKIIGALLLIIFAVHSNNKANTWFHETRHVLITVRYASGNVWILFFYSTYHFLYPPFILDLLDILVFDTRDSIQRCNTPRYYTSRFGWPLLWYCSTTANRHFNFWCAPFTGFWFWHMLTQLLLWWFCPSLKALQPTKGVSSIFILLQSILLLKRWDLRSPPSVQGATLFLSRKSICAITFRERKVALIVPRHIARMRQIS